MERATDKDMVHLHVHTDEGSNYRIKDSINKVEKIIPYVNELGNNGIAITDHECLSAHISAINVVDKLKQDNKLDQDFKLILGNEIYLVDENEMKRQLENKEKVNFYHFLLLAKDLVGHEQLRKLSSRAWRDNYFYHKNMARVPTYYSDIEEVIGDNKGHIIACTACLGSLLGNISNKILETEDEEEIYNLKSKMMDFIEWCQEVFGEDNFYLEMQPNENEEQIEYNKILVNISKGYDIPLVITTDAHYMTKEARKFHKAFLTSEENDANREVDDFYSTTRFFKADELYDYMDYLEEDVITEAILNTKKISDRCENYNWFKTQQIPLTPLPPKEEWYPIDKDVINQYPNIKAVYEDEYEHHTYLIHQIFRGIHDRKINVFDMKPTLERVDLECSELVGISKNLNQPTGGYLTTMQVIEDLLWKVSIVGAGRGSAVGWIINYLLNITQINPIKQEGMKLQHWRFMNAERVTFPDIDIDYSSHKKNTGFKVVKDYYESIGGTCVRVMTKRTETSKSAVNTVMRGLHINNDIASAVSSLIPVERGKVWSISDTYYGNPKKGRQPVKEFVNMVDQYKDINLLESMLNIEGLISGCSSHASGVLCLNTPLEEHSSYMRTPSGELITAYDLHQEESVGATKFDFLLTNGMSLIQTSMELLLKNGLMKWQGSLRKTYDKYLLPEVLDMKDEKIWDLICKGKIMNLFQFETPVGSQCIKKLQPRTLVDLANANSLMRLSNPNGEQPLDKYIRFRDNPNLWEEEMNEYKLTEEEKKTLHEELDNQCGVCSNQESLMELVRNNKIANFTIKESDMLRKVIAKKEDDKAIEKIKELFYNKGYEIGTSKNLLDYIWNVQVNYQLGYSFSLLHTNAYSTIGYQEGSIYKNYPPIYWYTANLMLMSGSLEKEEIDDDYFEVKEKTTNYGETAKAISQLQKENVEISLPDINEAELGFIPNEKDNNIIFGLKGIQGINEEASKIIIKNRPYKSLEDFHKRLVLVKKEVVQSTGKKCMKSLISESQCITLIKAGAFDKIENKPREQILQQYLLTLNPPKKTLTMQSINRIIELGIIPEDKQKYLRFYNFREYIKGFDKIKIEDAKQYWLIVQCEDEEDTEYVNNFIDEFFMEDMEENIGYKYNNKGYLMLLMGTKKNGSFEKSYDNKMNEFKKWLNTEECLNLFNEITFNEVKNKYAEGNISKWEMDSLSFYYHDHELKNVDREKYQISKFTELPDKPEIIGYNEYRGIKYPKYELTRICGTVLDRNKNKHLITLLTPEEVVTIKFYSGNFSFYDKNISYINNEGNKVTLENGWFKRGNKLMITGYRIDDKFIPKKYKNSIFKHTVQLISSIDKEGNLTLQSDRIRVEDYE